MKIIRRKSTCDFLTYIIQPNILLYKIFPVIFSLPFSQLTPIFTLLSTIFYLSLSYPSPLSFFCLLFSGLLFLFTSLLAFLAFPIFLYIFLSRNFFKVLYHFIYPCISTTWIECKCIFYIILQSKWTGVEICHWLINQNTTCRE